jgi:hypothetical protein
MIKQCLITLFILTASSAWSYDRHIHFRDYKDYLFYKEPLKNTDPMKELTKKVLSTQHFTIYQLEKPGYYHIESRLFGQKEDINLFAPPYASIINEGQHGYWYKTQFNTVTPSNCGPANIAMSVKWATGKDVSVYDIRKSIGWNGHGINNPEVIQRMVREFMADQNNNPYNGGTSIAEIKKALTNYGVQFRAHTISDSEQLAEIIDRGNIAIVLFTAGDIGRGDQAKHSFEGRYYTYRSGHYVVVKGRTKDKNFFIVSDPMPSDWSANSFRYSDGTSQIGRTRYYATQELVPSIYGETIEVLPSQ